METARTIESDRTTVAATQVAAYGIGLAHPTAGVGETR